MTFGVRKNLCRLMVGIHAFLLLSGTAIPAAIDTDVPRLKDDPPRVAGDRRYAIPLNALSGNPAVDALISGYQWSTSIVTYSFYNDAAFGGAYYGNETVSGVSEIVKINYRQIFEWLGNVVGIEFQEVTESAPDTYGMIRIMLSNAPSYASSYYPSMYSPLGGDIHLSPAYQNATDHNGWETPPGYHGYLTLIHELGHALGLKHPFEDGATLPLEEDNQSHTVMTYTFSTYEPATYMTYDVMALHYLYGASPNQEGRTVYHFDMDIDRYHLGDLFIFDSPRLFKQAVWDSGGTDTLNLSILESAPDGYHIDMTPGGWLVRQNGHDVTTFIWGTALCADAYIENVINSSSNDIIYLNGQPNRIGGYAPKLSTGHDRIENADTQDTLDLRAFRPGDVIESRDGDDLLLTLNHNSSIRIVGYYTGNTPRVAFSAPLAPIYHLLLD
jgi:serralysin